METKPRSDSVDSRSYSFDSIDSKIIIKNIVKKRRKREQNNDFVAKSPVPDKSMYFTLMDNLVSEPHK